MSLFPRERQAEPPAWEEPAVQRKGSDSAVFVEAEDDRQHRGDDKRDRKRRHDQPDIARIIADEHRKVQERRAAHRIGFQSEEGSERTAAGAARWPQP